MSPSHGRVLLTALGLLLASSPAYAQFGVQIRPMATGGVVVTFVQPNSAAKEMGVEPGDRIITVNGKLINAPGDISAAIAGASKASAVWVNPATGQYYTGEAGLPGLVVESVAPKVGSAAGKSVGAAPGKSVGAAPKAKAKVTTVRRKPIAKP
ncbi:MAG: PDZ domain-containing protein [Gemmataceae bacterium]